MTKFKTNNNTKHKDELVKILQHNLADLVTFKLQVKHAHWNVRGLDFYQVHVLFDEIAEELLPLIDMVAEKITILGGVAKGLVPQVNAETCLTYPEDAVTVEEHLKALIESLGNLANQVREDADKADELESATTEDLLIEVARFLDKKLWFLEAHVVL